MDQLKTLLTYLIVVLALAAGWLEVRPPHRSPQPPHQIEEAAP